MSYERIYIETRECDGCNEEWVKFLLMDMEGGSEPKLKVESQCYGVPSGERVIDPALALELLMGSESDDFELIDGARKLLEKMLEKNS